LVKLCPIDYYKSRQAKDNHKGCLRGIRKIGLMSSSSPPDSSTATVLSPGVFTESVVRDQKVDDDQLEKQRPVVLPRLLQASGFVLQGHLLHD